MDVVNFAPVQINIQVCPPRSLNRPAMPGCNPYGDSNPGYPMQAYFGGVQDDMGWMQSPFQSYPQPFNPYGGGFGPQDAQMSAYFQQMQTVLSMQIAVLDRMIAILMMQMQMQQGGQMPYQNYPTYPNTPQPCGCGQPEPQPYDPEPQPYYPEPYYPPVSYNPPTIPELLQLPPVAPTSGPAPDQAAERARKVDRFEQSLLGGVEVRPDDILRLAAEAEVPELGEKLLTVLAQGDPEDSYNFSDPRNRELLDIFCDVAKANGDVSVLARALKRWSQSEEIDTDLPKECFDALVEVAGNPEGADRLAQQLDEANGWDGDCNLEDDDVQQALSDWSDPTVQKSQDRPKILAKLAQNLRRTHGEVDSRAILSIALESGLDEQEARNFLNFLYAALDEDSDEALDFDDPQVRDLVDVYVEAGQANGDVGILAKAMRRYRDSEAIDGDGLTGQAFDALVQAAAGPDGRVNGAEQLRQALEPDADDWEDGIDLDDEEPRALLNND